MQMDCAHTAGPSPVPQLDSHVVGSRVQESILHKQRQHRSRVTFENGRALRLQTSVNVLYSQNDHAML